MNFFIKIITVVSILILMIFYLFINVFLPLNLNFLQSSSIIYDSNNIEIWEIVYWNKIRHREIKYNEIPEFYKKALISLEDKSFYYNNGISISWLIRSIIHNIQAWKIIEWGSTISSQFIRNNLWLNEKRSFWKKALEFIYAIRLNWKYSKKEILEKYVNQIYFWYLNYWLKSASYYFFAKEPQNLTKAEQIALLIIPKNIKKYDPYLNFWNFENRFNLILDALEKNWIIKQEEKYLIKNEKLFFNEDHKNKLPYIIDFLNQSKKHNLNIDLKSNLKLTIDYNLTQKIEEIAKNVIFELSWKNVKDYWILVFDKESNDLKVMIWGINYYKQEWQVNSTLALRQPWSTIKPFTYLLASKILWFKPDDTILDLPINYKTIEWYSYSPKNYSLEFQQEVSLAEALAQSINVPAVNVLSQIWVKTLLDFLKLIWITSLNQSEDHYWLALTLWVWEVNLFELTRAYSIFTNDWKFCEVNILLNNTNSSNNCKYVIEKKYTDIINEILTNRYYKLAGYPINSALDFKDKIIFFKTGTSRNFRDNWIIWYTSKYLIWIWVWNKDASNMKWVSGATWAWEIFSRIVNFLETNTLENKIVNIKKNSLPFLKIISPLNWDVFKIDQFKSKNIQKIKLNFSTNIDFDKFEWLLNNEKLKWDFISVMNEWVYKLKIQLFKSNEIIKIDEVIFRVQE